MEYSKEENEVLKEALEQVAAVIVELAECQLAMVGGGSGEVSPY